MSGLARCLLLCSSIWASFCSVSTWGEAASPLRTGPLARWLSCCCGFITRRRFYSSVRSSPSFTPASIVRISNRCRAQKQPSWRMWFPNRATPSQGDEMSAGEYAMLGFADPLVLGLIGGVLEAIPYLGPILSALPALLFALGKGGL